MYKTRSEKIKHLQELNAEEIKDLTKSYYPEERAISEIQCTPMSEEWKENQKRCWWSTHYTGPTNDVSAAEDAMYTEAKKKYQPLVDKLLSIGGEQVCLPDYEEDFEKIMERGQIWTGKHSVKMMKGRPSQCHKNSCDLWVNNKDKSVIATGYALSDDGMWRQHSWLIHIKPSSVNVIETTVKREAYFGFTMTYDECVEFDDANL